MKSAFARVARGLLFALALPEQHLAKARETPTLEFHFSCPTLTESQATEVEARSRVEAQLAGRGRMTVHFACSTAGLEVRLQPSPEGMAHEVRGEPTERPLEVALVDLFVLALGSLPVESPAHDGKDPARAAIPAAQDQAAQESAVATPAPPEQAEPPPTPDPETDLEPSARPRPAPPPRVPFARLQTDAFVSYESLGSEATGTLGLGLGAFLGLHDRVRLGPTLRVGWGTGMPHHLSLTAWNIGLMGEFSPFDWLSLGLGPIVSIHVMNAQQPTAAGDAHVLWGGSASASVLLGSRAAALRAGLAMNALSSERIVRVGGTELMHIPPLSLEAHLGGRLGFFLE